MQKLVYRWTNAIRVTNKVHFQANLFSFKETLRMWGECHLRDRRSYFIKRLNWVWLRTLSAKDGKSCARRMASPETASASAFTERSLKLRFIASQSSPGLRNAPASLTHASELTPAIEEMLWTYFERPGKCTTFEILPTVLAQSSPLQWLQPNSFTSCKARSWSAHSRSSCLVHSFTRIAFFHCSSHFEAFKFLGMSRWRCFYWTSGTWSRLRAVERGASRKHNFKVINSFTQTLDYPEKQTRIVQSHPYRLKTYTHIPTHPCSLD